MNYVEIYQLDVLNLPAEITYAHDLLLGPAPPASTPPPIVPPQPPTGLIGSLMQPRPARLIVRLKRSRPAMLLILAHLFAATGVQAGEDNPGEATGLNSLPEVEFKALSQHDWNPLGARALVIHAPDWKHGETEHFVYHFIHSYVATPISVEAEFNYRVIAKELGLDTMPPASGKSHIYIFEKPEDWKSFQGEAHLEPWTGGIHSLGSLFIVRRSELQILR